ncbi:mini-chromosome maintenance complex-binding protein-like [Pyrus ussuriensis x Pyrus communis]|uniref:Mini-chromosome maintenance complex-binding protein-like n=1 Tax=Pyrus ussuriensis x Pyrus communis TaxID=2448454 RepID=A0A5N5IAV9_9ROSA|nr:mini-chromosome maintenance complex-binding protein-like [Pyrus ussuriensis x Pyrus communis]KAB2634850.1 mini-chromosome maintenance complex-binding protein-like [Pyrus ussuriensis x Pyrus communis]
MKFKWTVMGITRSYKPKENGHSSLPTPSQQSITEDTSSSVIMEPHVDRDLLPYLIKVNDCLEAGSKLNEVFEFFGVFTFDSEFKEDKDASDDFTNGFSEDVLVHLPPNKPKPNVVKEIRESLLRHLTTVFGNDGIAATFMLLHLMSTVNGPSHIKIFGVGST